MDVFAVIVLFYLVLLLKWEMVRRPILYWVGMLAIVATMFFDFFRLGDGTAVRTLHMVFTLITTVVALGCAVGAVYCGQLPASVQKAMDQVTQPPK
jgi:ABC-type thiamin/hydroxymethylpyrimidine transport system permease subunit